MPATGSDRKWLVFVDGSAVSGKAFDAACSFINIQVQPSELAKHSYHAPEPCLSQPLGCLAFAGHLVCLADDACHLFRFPAQHSMGGTDDLTVMHAMDKNTDDQKPFHLRC